MSAPVLPELEAAHAAASALTLERDRWWSRAPRLGEHTPTEVLALAAVVLVGNALRRQTWQSEDEMSERTYARLVKSDASRTVQTPDEVLRAGSFQMLGAGTDAVPVRCSQCAVRPGLVLCSKCHGSGQLQVQVNGNSHWMACSCHAGFVSCTHCEGTTRAVRVTVRYVTDTLVPIEEWIVPAAASTARSALHELGAPSTRSEYRCELGPAALESAYRGTSGMVAPRFFDFDLADAAERARDRLAHWRGAMHRLDVHSIAVPFFLLRYRIGAKPYGVVVRRGADGGYLATSA